VLDQILHSLRSDAEKSNVRDQLLATLAEQFKLRDLMTKELVADNKACCNELKKMRKKLDKLNGRLSSSLHSIGASVRVFSSPVFLHTVTH
jgi:hypothetical protein